MPILYAIYEKMGNIHFTGIISGNNAVIEEWNLKWSSDFLELHSFFKFLHIGFKSKPLIHSKLGVGKWAHVQILDISSYKNKESEVFSLANMHENVFFLAFPVMFV